ncbi:MAG TPA: tetratricopeptide repeat protein, partial [Blastocatellia bacterium]|nr:tetratricopeptide repeat protein [Blastocatellia bacterium]
MPPEELANYLAQVLTQWPVLLILDNFETHLERAGSGFEIADPGMRSFLATLVGATATGTKFIFTSRYLFDLDRRRIGLIQDLPLGDLSRPEALGLMQKLPRLALAPNEEKAGAFEMFGGHPYALVALDRYCGHASLTEALRNAKPIHEELREFIAIDLNYRRLTDRARELLNRLAAFRGPVSPDAAEWVMGEKTPQAELFLQNMDRSGLPEEWKDLDEAALAKEIEKYLPEHREAQALDQPISELIDWGLLTPVSYEGQLREIAVHSLVRDFCRERQGIETWRIRLRDAAAFYTDRTKLVPDDEKTPAAVWGEIEAFELLMEAQGYEDAASILAAATPLLHRWGFGRVLESMYVRTMAKVDRKQAAHLFHNFGRFLQDRGEYAEALAKYDESLRIKEELGDRAGVASSLHQIGMIHEDRGEYGEAMVKYEESLKTNEELGNREGVAISLHEIGIIHQYRGEYAEALEKYEESLRIAEELGDRAGVAGSLHQVGMIHQERGEYAEALGKYEESLRINEELGNSAGGAISRGQMGMLLTQL